MDFEICCSASNHITPKKQVGANWDAESVKMFTGHRVIKRSRVVISLFWIVFALSALLLLRPSNGRKMLKNQTLISLAFTWLRKWEECFLSGHLNISR